MNILTLNNYQQAMFIVMGKVGFGLLIENYSLLLAKKRRPYIQRPSLMMQIYFSKITQLFSTTLLTLCW